MPNYWVVGAMWQRGTQDQLELFIQRGYWRLGWSKDDDPAQAARRDQIRPGDRIAVKRMLGQGASEIEIRALGLVKDIDEEDQRIYVHWAATDLQRRVPGRGCFQSIHGPFDAADSWTKDVFQL